MPRRKGSKNKKNVKYNIFFGVNLTKDQHYWLLKLANKEKTTLSKIVRKIINDRINSESMKSSLQKFNISIKEIKNEELIK